MSRMWASGLWFGHGSHTVGRIGFRIRAASFKTSCEPFNKVEDFESSELVS